ncbi:serine hydrolase [Chitinophagaceae bacterium MMS25-I14]
MRLKRTCCIIMLSLSAQAIFAQANYSKETTAQIKAVENSLAGRVKIEGMPDYNITDRMKYYKVKGLSIAVVHNYKVVWAKGYGWANEAEKKPVTPETLFEPGSISKSLNAVGVLKLVQDKKLDLYTDINTYLTSWKFPYDSVSKNKKITLVELLSHSAGLTVHGFPGYDPGAKIPTVPQVLNGEPPANTPPVRSQFEPGLRFEYSGGGTVISQLIVTDVTGQPYDAFMYEQVLKPMGMVHSFFTQPPAKEKQPLCATGYHIDGSAVPHRYHVYPEQAAAGLWMTPTDLCQYIIETQLAYEGKSAKVLTPEMTRLRLTPYNDEAAALGVFIEKRGTAIYFQHDAGNEGFCGAYYGSLEGGDGVVIFANTDYSGIFTEIINSVATVYKWKDFYNPAHKKAVAVPENILQQYEGIYIAEGKWNSILKKDGAWYLCVQDGPYSKMYFSSPGSFFNMEFPSEKQFTKDEKGAITGYTRTVNGKAYPPAVKVTRPDTLHLDKNMLNDIAWHLLENKRPAEAMLYLKRALQLTPGDLFVLGNLAHSYLFTNNYTAAIEIYKAHMNETVGGNITWQDMIKQDFTTFKGDGFSTGEMNKVLTDLGIPKPEGF